MDNKKTNPLKTTFTILFSLLIASAFMYFALKGMEMEKLKSTFVRANYLWVGIAFLLGLAAYWLRSARWNLLLKPMGHPISTNNALWSLSFGYLMNLTIPRSGELARATALYGVEKVPVEKSFGTIILERLVDLIFMAIFLMLTAIFRYDALIAFYKNIQNQSPNNTQQGFPWKILLVGLMLLSIVLLFLYRKKIAESKIGQKIISFINGLIDGLKSILHLENKWLFIAYSVGIWLSYYGASYLICFALPETSHFNFADGFFIISVGTLGMMVPASGGIGAFHLALKFGIMALFLSVGKDTTQGGEVGLAYAFLSHGVQMVLMIIMGLISIIMLARQNKI